jgi:hypothetical protein
MMLRNILGSTRRSVNSALRKSRRWENGGRSALRHIPGARTCPCAGMRQPFSLGDIYA